VPRPYLTGETIEAVLDDVGPRRAARLRGARFASREEVLAFLRRELEEEGRDLATLGASSSLCSMWPAKNYGFRCPRCSAAHRAKVLPRRCHWLRCGFAGAEEALCFSATFGQEHIKIKVGRADDLDRLRIFSEVFGKDARLCLDANGAWAATEAIARLLAIQERFVVDWVEQPVARDDLAGMRCVREQTVSK